MVYGYICSGLQSELSDLQENMRQVGVDVEDVYIDCAEDEQKSDRENLTKLLDRLQSGDLIYIPSLSHLGTHYSQIVGIWNKITNEMQADICVMDTDGLDTRRGKDAAGPLLAETVAETLDFVSRNEYEKNRKRQKEGYQRARSRGVQFGRPPKDLPDEFETIAQAWMNREISGKDAAAQLGMPLSTFRYRAKQMGYILEKKEIEE